jgi:hypothetical protein
MTTKSLWIDDIRTPDNPDQYDIARTYDEAIDFLSKNKYNTIFLDHDLADFKDGKERTGYTIVLWLAERAHNGLYVPHEYKFLTANPVGRRNMAAVIEKYLTKEESSI